MARDLLRSANKQSPASTRNLALRFKAIITRNLLLLSLVSLLNDFATDLVVPILPLFITVYLGGTALMVGLMEGLADSIAAFLRYFSGRISDRVGRRKGLTLFGYAISNVAKLFYGFATHSLHVVGIRATDRLGKGIREAPRDAILAESTPSAHWGFVFGFHRMLDTTGALLGPLAGLVLIFFLGTGEGALRTIFFFAAVPGLLAVFLVTLVRETGTGTVRSEPQPFIPRQALHGPLARYLLVTILFTVGHLSVVFLLLRATELGLSLVSIIFLYTCYNAVEMVGSLPVGWLTDRVGRAPILLTAYTLFSITWGLVAVVNPSRWWALLPFFMLLGLARALREGQGRAFVADLCPANIRATSFGAYHATIGFLALPAGLLAGRLWSIDYRWTFVVAQAACGLAALAFSYYWLRGRFGGRKQDAQEDQHAATVDQESDALAKDEDRQDG
jgi:MFS family permease